MISAEPVKSLWQKEQLKILIISRNPEWVSIFFHYNEFQAEVTWSYLDIISHKSNYFFYLSVINPVKPRDRL